MQDTEPQSDPMVVPEPSMVACCHRCVSVYVNGCMWLEVKSALSGWMTRKALYKMQSI